MPSIQAILKKILLLFDPRKPGSLDKQECLRRMETLVAQPLYATAITVCLSRTSCNSSRVFQREFEGPLLR